MLPVPLASLPGKGNLLADLACRNQCFGKADAIVFKKHDFKFCGDFRILVDIGSDKADKLDDLFGHIITGRSLGAEQESLRLNVKVRIFFQIHIKRNDAQRVEKLPFVFMKSFDLHIIQ